MSDGRSDLFRVTSVKWLSGSVKRLSVAKDMKHTKPLEAVDALD